MDKPECENAPPDGQRSNGPQRVGVIQQRLQARLDSLEKTLIEKEQDRGWQERKRRWEENVAASRSAGVDRAELFRWEFESALTQSRQDERTPEERRETVTTVVAKALGAGDSLSREKIKRAIAGRSPKQVREQVLVTLSAPQVVDPFAFWLHRMNQTAPAHRYATREQRRSNG